MSPCSNRCAGAVLCALLACCGGTEKPPPSPVDTDADASPAFAEEEGLYCAATPQCSSESDLYVVGTSPFGTLELDALSVSYLTGDTIGTRLIFEGSSDGRPFMLFVRLVSDVAPDGEELAVSPAGSYWAESAHILRTLPDGSCAIDSLQAEVEILEHEAPSAPAAGDRIYFGGTVFAEGQGWQLEVAFEARRACGTTRDE
jgi:hypothetical protein